MQDAPCWIIQPICGCCHIRVAFVNSQSLRDYDKTTLFSKKVHHKKSPQISLKTSIWVEDGARTHDPRYHKPML